MREPSTTAVHHVLRSGTGGLERRVVAAAASHVSVSESEPYGLIHKARAQSTETFHQFEFAGDIPALLSVLCMQEFYGIWFGGAERTVQQNRSTRQPTFDVGLAILQTLLLARCGGDRLVQHAGWHQQRVRDD